MYYFYCKIDLITIFTIRMYIEYYPQIFFLISYYRSRSIPTMGLQVCP